MKVFWSSCNCFKCSLGRPVISFGGNSGFIFPSLPKHFKDDHIRIFAQRFYRCTGSVIWVIAE